MQGTITKGKTTLSIRILATSIAKTPIQNSVNKYQVLIRHCRKLWHKQFREEKERTLCQESTGQTSLGLTYMGSKLSVTNQLSILVLKTIMGIINRAMKIQTPIRQI